MPSYYYSNTQPTSLKGLSLEISPYSKPLLGIEKTFKPGMFDITVAYNSVLLPKNYKDPIAPEISFFINYASYKPMEDTLYYPVEQNNVMVDYGTLVLSNMKLMRGGAQITLWNNTAKKNQFGPGLGVSVGNYSYDYDARAIPDSSIVKDKMSQTFVMFSPSLASKIWLGDNFGMTLSIAYNIIVETEKKSKDLEQVNPDLIKSYATLTPRIGLFYTFNRR